MVATVKKIAKARISRTLYLIAGLCQHSFTGGGAHPRRVLTLTPRRGFAVRGEVWPQALLHGVAAPPRAHAYPLTRRGFAVRDEVWPQALLHGVAAPPRAHAYPSPAADSQSATRCGRRRCRHGIVLFFLCST